VRRYLLPGDKVKSWSPWKLRCYQETLPVTKEMKSDPYNSYELTSYRLIR
jgi:hypothetical protein